MGLVESNYFLDAIFIGDVNDTYNEFETAIRSANIQLSPQVYRNSALENSISSRYGSGSNLSRTPLDFGVFSLRAAWMTLTVPQSSVSLPENYRDIAGK